MLYSDIIINMTDVAIVAGVLYFIFMRIRGTRVVQTLKGVLLILVVWGVSKYIGLQMVQFILSQVIVYGLLGLLIIFQPEVRSALEQLGKGRSKGKQLSDSEQIITSIVGMAEYCSPRRIGVLLVLEKETPLKEYIDTGIALDANVKKELLMNIFTPNVPLHDGATIIAGGRIVSSACYLPLSDSESISKELGTRHRAAIGLTEVTDSLVVVVSEETGVISVSENGKLYRNLDAPKLEMKLNTFFGVNAPKDKSDKIVNIRRSS